MTIHQGNPLHTHHCRSMKTSLRSTSHLLGILSLSFLLLSGLVHAQFSSSLTISGETFNFVSEDESGYPTRYDTYELQSDTSKTVTIETNLDMGTDLAAVSGADSQGSVSGYLSSGVYYDYSRTSTTSTNWGYEGVTFDTLETWADEWIDLYEGSIYGSGSYTYTSSGGQYQDWWDEWGSGWSFDQYNTAQHFGSGAISLFGASYAFVTGSENSYESSYDSDWYSGSGWTDQFASGDGGTMTVEDSTDDYNSETYSSISGWDPYAGNFSAEGADINNLSWSPRPDPSFLPRQLWVNGTLVNWQNGRDYSGRHHYGHIQ